MNKSAKEKEAVLNVFAALVRPLIPVAFEYGISASEISGVVRRTFVQALEERLLNQRRATTDARLAAVSGLTKSDVSALREATRAGAPHSLRATISLDQVTNLLTVWHTQSGYSGAYGLALELDLQPVSGSPRRSFKELVDIACPGADTEALLDELVAAASVEVIDDSTVRCLSRAYVPKGADVKRIERMGRFLSLIAANFVHNLLRISPEPVYFERAVVSDEVLSDSARDRFLGLASERGQELLTELDTFLTRLAVSDPSDSGRKYGVGIYFFEDQPNGQSDDLEDGDLYEERSVRAVPVILEEIDVLAGINQKK
jgi:Family of unknown function (DUF6502)